MSALIGFAVAAAGGLVAMHAARRENGAPGWRSGVATLLLLAGGGLWLATILEELIR